MINHSYHRKTKPNSLTVVGFFLLTIAGLSMVPFTAKAGTRSTSAESTSTESTSTESNRSKAAKQIQYRQLDNHTLLTIGKQQWQLTAIENDTIEVLDISAGKKPFPSFSKKESLQSHPLKINRNKNSVSLTNGELSATIVKGKAEIAFYYGGKLLTRLNSKIMTASHADYPVNFNFSLQQDEKILGGGERIVGMDRRGHRFPLYNKAHYGYTTESEQMYYSLPAVMSSKKYLLLFDNSAKGWLDIGKTNKDVVNFSAVGGRRAVIVVGANSFPQLIKNYTAVTGRQPMPPRWALGNIASRFGYHSQQEVEKTVQLYLDKGFPLEAIVLDLYWFGPDIKGHMGNLAWDKKAFPQPSAMIKKLHQQGVNTILITEPFVLSSSKRWQQAVDNNVLATKDDGKPYRFDFYFGNTGLIDIFDKNAKDWFWQTYKNLFAQDVTGSWGDLGEPEVHPDDIKHWLSADSISASGAEVHNAYGHEWAKMVFTRQRKLQPEVRPFIMMRSGTAGTQRYGIIPWTGDVSRSWGGLKPQVELGLQMGLFGLGYIHSDAGGFAGGEKFDRELYLRWLEFAAFQPVFRPHAQEHIPSEPVYHDPLTQKISKQIIQLRYRLMPYLYTLAFDNSQSGIPLMRPRFFDDESQFENESNFDNKMDYFWGDSFLVSPVVDPAKKTQSVSLPKGVWFNFWSDQKVSGASYDFPLTLETIPVLVKAGAFIPTVQPYQNAEQYSSDTLTLHYYADDSVTSSSAKMYEDDGKTFDAFGKGRYELLKFHARQENGKLSINLVRQPGKNYPPLANRHIQLIIHGWNKTSVVKGEEQRLPAFYSKANKKLSFDFDWDGREKTVTIESIN